MRQVEKAKGLEQVNWYFLGQKNIVSFLKKALLKDALFPTILFCGSEHLGKKTLALRLFMAAHCDLEEKPCFECLSCKKILKGESEDVFVLEDKTIKIKQVRELKKKLSLKHSRKFFCLINGYESLSMEAEHAILKMLEEPSPNVHFVILARNKRAVLKTILSRSLFFQFSMVSKTDIEKYFKDNNIPFEEEIIDFIGGRPGLAKEYQKNQELENSYASHRELLENVLSSDPHEKFTIAKKIVEDEDLDLLFSEWITLYKKAMISKIEGRTDPIHFRTYSLSQISQIIKNLEASKSLLSKKVNKKLVLENIFLNL